MPNDFLKYPSETEYRRDAAEGMRVPFVAEIPHADPADLYARLAPRDEFPSLLLESSRLAGEHGRWSFVLVEPSMRLRARGERLRVESGGRTEEREGDPLVLLRQVLSERRIRRPEGLPPFCGGFAGLFNYELKNRIERSAHPVEDVAGFPDIDLGFFDKGVAVDHLEKRTYTFLLSRTGVGYVRLCADAQEWRNRVLSAPASVRRGANAAPIETAVPHVQLEANAPAFKRGVESVKQYIRNGDVFQVNLSHCLRFDFGGEAFPLYRRQREVNPTSFAAYAELGDYRLVCGSPERLVRLEGRKVSTRPIAGTRPRSRDAAEDGRLSAELLMSPKERAEHVMLIDLERNDLGRVCEYGSVNVDELMALEEYSHVRHIVSNVSGTLRADRDAFDVLRSLFPGGTITGAPKVRAMQIIDELEGRARGPYTGALGYIGCDGDCDLNIIIRTLVLKDGVAHLPVGAGIVADSDPDREYGETLDKAKALLKVLRIEASVAPRTAALA